jgi:hypothetical protein
MAQQQLKAPRFNTDPFNTGDSTERGDTPTQAITKINANDTELYGTVIANGSKYVTSAAAGPATAAAGDLTGGSCVICNYSAIGAANLTTRTAAQMIADANLSVGQTYELEIMNSNGAGPMTLLGGTGVTVSGTATIAANGTRWFSVKVNSATTMTIQNVGSGTI